MAGILSGLEQFGFSNLEEVKVFEQQKKEESSTAESKTAEVTEQDLLFDKSYVCPICDKEFKVKTVKVGKAKLVGTDLDLRPKYANVDMLKYDIILCPHCGYATLSRYFKFITSPQMKLIKENISKVFKAKPEAQKDIYTFEEALERYKLALANAIVKQAKPSEKAYICLKAAWLIRGESERLDPTASDYQNKKVDLAADEDEFLHNALEGFLAARQAESFPMCGMDEPTVDYLIAVTALHFNQFEIASKLISGILSARETNPRMKDKARDLKDILMKKLKEQKDAR